MTKASENQFGTKSEGGGKNNFVVEEVSEGKTQLRCIRVDSYTSSVYHEKNHEW